MSEPTLPVKERLVLAVVAALENISAADGYFSESVSVVRPRRTGDGTGVNVDRLIRVIQGNDDPDSENNLDGNPPAIAWKFALQIDAIIRVSQRSDQPMDAALNLLEADVCRALMADCRFGGLALDSKLGHRRYPLGENGLEGITQWFFLTYRVAENDPRVNRA